ncbi:MAG: PASTA domain-containing protein [Bacteroidales bacterium]|nr:PASTA domain-containing protein [Bacteroidales bacterium]
MGLGNFLKSKAFFKHLLLIILSFFALLFIVMQLLKIYTRHGKEYEVPKITDSLYSDVAQSDEMRLFELVIIDSVYREDLKPGLIITQDPYAGSMVKKGRKIYVTVTATAGEIVSMPNCENLSLKTAVQSLVDKGLKIGTLMFRPADIVSNGFVVEQKFKGQRIRSGADIQSGEAVDLIVEVPSTTATVKIPDLLGKTEKDAEILLWKAGLNVGFKQYDGKKEGENMRVVSYSPLAKNVTLGTSISLNFMDGSKSKYREKINQFEKEKIQIEVQEDINSAIEEQIIIDEVNDGGME